MGYEIYIKINHTRIKITNTREIFFVNGLGIYMSIISCPINEKRIDKLTARREGIVASRMDVLLVRKSQKKIKKNPGSVLRLVRLDVPFALGHRVSSHVTVRVWS